MEYPTAKRRPKGRLFACERAVDVRSKSDTTFVVNNRHKKTLALLYSRPERGDLRWGDVAALLVALGCRELAGDGSRVRFVSSSGLILRLHRPHPRPEVDKGAVKSIRRFLEEMGVKP